MTTEQKNNVILLINALRSGEYKQGSGTLHKITDGTHLFCCLGVACEVAIKQGLDIKVEPTYRQHEYDGRTGYLPKKAMEFYGFVGFNGSYGIQQLGYVQRSLTTDNDSGVPFTAIADTIQKALDGEDAYSKMFI